MPTLRRNEFDAPCGGGQSGFTLIEMLVALAILGLSLSVLIGVFAHAADRSRSNRQSMAARVLAQSIMDTLTRDPTVAAFDREGRTASDIAWHASVMPVNAPEIAQDEPKPAQASVTVSWNGGSYRISTLVLLADAQ
jgi:general secretion pathway protein I